MRQAISLALFPDHEVQSAALLSDSNAALVKEFDLVIIDSAALNETGNSITRDLTATSGLEDSHHMDRRYRKGPNRGSR